MEFVSSTGPPEGLEPEFSLEGDKLQSRSAKVNLGGPGGWKRPEGTI